MQNNIPYPKTNPKNESSGTVKNPIDTFNINPDTIKTVLIGWNKCSVCKSIMAWIYKPKTIKTINHEDKFAKANLLNINRINAAIMSSFMRYKRFIFALQVRHVPLLYKYPKNGMSWIMLSWVLHWGQKDLGFKILILLSSSGSL